MALTSCVCETQMPLDNGQFQRWPSSQRQIPWYRYKDLVTRNASVQNESSDIDHFVMNNVYFFFQRNMSNVKVKNDTWYYAQG